LLFWERELKNESNSYAKWKMLAGLLIGGALAVAGSPAVPAEKSGGAAAKLDREARSALTKLYDRSPAAKALGAKAVAVLVFPSVKKAGLMIGGQHGEGTLLKSGKPVAHYSTAGASYGLQAGVQTFGYALFFMNEEALAQLDKAQGFEVGAGPSVVIMDEGLAKTTTTTTTLKDDIYAFIFSQKGLMAGVGLQGNKITKIDRR
jgi:lipid-binding SYLF domain-containing protein